MSRRAISWVLYWIVAGVFGYAAILKLLDPEAFLSSLLTYEVFPFVVAGGLALFAPILELLLAVCLATGWLRRGATLLTGAMLLVFIVLVIQGGMRGLTLDCGCFGSRVVESGWEYVRKTVENLLLLVVLCGASILGKTRSHIH